MSLKEKVLGAEARWLMGRVMAGDVLEGVGKYLHLVAPEREEEELNAAIRAGAGELAEADKDLVVDKPSEGAGDRCRGAGVVRDAAPAVRR